MDQIYGNAFITIAAAAAKNVHQGIFCSRKIPKIVQLPHKSQDPYDYITWDDICGQREKVRPFIQPLMGITGGYIVDQGFDLQIKNDVVEVPGAWTNNVSRTVVTNIISTT